MEQAAPTILKTLQAVITLADAGVSDEALGKAVREWLRAQNVGAISAGTSLTQNANAAAEIAPHPVPGPVKTTETLFGTLPYPQPAKPAYAPSSPLTQDSVGLGITVKVQVEGKAPTTVKIPSNLWNALVQLPGLGSETAVRYKIREMAKKAPHSESLTVWMRGNLQQLLGQLG